MKNLTLSDADRGVLRAALSTALDTGAVSATDAERLIARLDAVPRPKPAKAVLPTVDINTLTDKQLFEYRKRTSPVDDLAFFLRTDLSPELRARAEAVAKPAAKIMASLREAWRVERLAAERVKRAAA